MKIVIEDVVIKYSDMVLQIAYQRTFSLFEAEDITQEVFVKLIDNVEKIENEEHLKAWLIRVAVNLSIDSKRSYWNKNVGELKENYTNSFDQETNSVFDKVKKITPPIYRQIIYLYYYQGYKIKEIAEILNISTNTVSSALTRAKKKLKDIIEEEECYE